MPCKKDNISKNNKCDKNSCLCLPTKGSDICLCENEMGNNTRCDCKCARNLCKCGGKCTCVNTAGYSCICVCRDEKGNVKTCEGCSCVPEQDAAVCCKGKSLTENCGCKCDDENCVCLNLGADSCICMCRNEKGIIKTCGGCVCKPSIVSCKGTYAQGVTISNDGTSKPCKCQGNARSCVCVCKNEQGETVCCNDCNCDENNRCDKKGCTCVPKESNIDAGKYVKKCVRFENTDSCICVCENKEGKLVCCVDCMCSDTNTCDKKGCACISKVSNVSIQTKSTEIAAHQCSNCICKNKQGELICCDDCKCDDDNICDKTGCDCVPKGSSTCIKVASSQTYCLCKTSTNSCICVCKNKQGELVCCDDCKCDDNSTCDKKGCACVPKGSTTCIKATSSKTDCFCKTSPVSCVCECKNEQGELVCCDDCKCDDNSTCDKKGCACVPKGSTTCIKATSSKTDCFCKTSPVSCVCECKNEQGELVCCDDCKCDNNSTCDKKGCACVPKGSTICIKAASSKTDCFCKTSPVSCVCECKNKQGELVCCDDCKCDNNSTCDKKGCACVPKGSTICIKAASSKTDCFCKTSPVSCVCVCKNEQGELVCCEDCKCDDNSTCDKKGCACVPKGSTTCIKAASSKTDCFCKTSPVSCVCVCKNEQGELVCCDDCKCDNDTSCDKQGCACVSKESVTCERGCSCTSKRCNTGICKM